MIPRTVGVQVSTTGATKPSRPVAWRTDIIQASISCLGILPHSEETPGHQKAVLICSNAELENQNQPLT